MMRVCAVLAAALLCACVSGELCERAQNRCVSRMGCSMALNMYFVSCGELLHGETTECSTKCKQSLISLVTADGQDLMECDCDGNDFCNTHRRRLAVCTKDVVNLLERVYDDHSAISCSLAEMVCRADSPCLTALEYYQGHCGRLWRGDRCSPRCNNSLAILHRQPKARKLRSCICDGTEEYPVPCYVIKENTERLCFHNDPYAPATTQHPHRHGHHRNSTRSHKHRPTERTPNIKSLDNQAGSSNSDVIDVKAQYSSSGASSSQWWHLPLLLLASVLLRTCC